MSKGDARRRQAVLCMPLRTAVGRYGGVLRTVTPQELAAVVIREIVRRTALDPQAGDDVILGNASPSGEWPAIGRIAALDAGLPVTTTGPPEGQRRGLRRWAGLSAPLEE